MCGSISHSGAASQQMSPLEVNGKKRELGVGKEENEKNGATEGE